MYIFLSPKIVTSKMPFNIIPTSIYLYINIYLYIFLQLEGSINDCSCDVDTVDHFNNMKIYPRLQSLLVKNFFRFYKVNLKQECPFWPDDSRCAIRFCQVENCEEQAIPQGIKDKGEHKEKAAFKVRKLW